MTQAPSEKPARLLLATDLSARCDRAFDRAVALAREWRARLGVVHALDALDAPNDHPSRPALRDAVARARRLMEADLAGVSGVEADLFVARGRPDEVVRDVAQKEGSGLIVTGIAGNDPIDQPLMGNTTARLARLGSIPVLIVKRRMRAPYARVVVASDLSDSSQVTLDLALRLFEPSQLTLFHAFETPLRGRSRERRRAEDDRRAKAEQAVRLYLAEVAGEAAAAQIGVVTAAGDPAVSISDHAAAEDVDLVVAGTHGRSGVMSVLLGSVAINILDEVPCDLLIVPCRDEDSASRDN